MKTSLEILMKAGLYPKLKLGERRGKAVVSTGPHKVKIIDDKIIKKMNTEGVEEFFVRYVFEENGEKKQYDAHMKAKIGNDPHYLVQALADCHEGEELILEMKKAGIKSYINVIRTETGESETAEIDDNQADDMVGALVEVANEEKPSVKDHFKDTYPPEDDTNDGRGPF